MASLALRHTASPAPPFESVLAPPPPLPGDGPGDGPVVLLRVEGEGGVDGGSRLRRVEARLGRLEAVGGTHGPRDKGRAWRKGSREPHAGPGRPGRAGLAWGLWFRV